MEIRKISDDYFVCGQITETDIKEIEALGIRTIINNRPDHEEPGQPSSASLATAAGKAHVQFHDVPFNSAPVPDDACESFAEIIAKAEKPILGFCRSGMRAEIIWRMVAR